MNRNEIKMLLAGASTFDPTVPAPDAQVLSVWAGLLDDVPAHVGQRALRDYYRSDEYRRHKRTITPGDIVGYWRDERRDEHQRQITHEIREQRRAIEAAPSTIPSIHAMFAYERARRCGADPQAAAAEAGDRSRWLAVPCPHCKARARETCTSLGTHRPIRAVHPTRIEAAKAAEATVS